MIDRVEEREKRLPAAAGGFGGRRRGGLALRCRRDDRGAREGRQWQLLFVLHLCRVGLSRSLWILFIRRGSRADACGWKSKV